MTDGLDLRTVLLLLVAVGALVAAWYVARRAPRLVVAGWAAVCFLVPIWVGVQAGIYWSAVTAVTAVALAAWSTSDFTFSYVDVLVVGFALLVLAAYVVGGSTWGHVLIVLFAWLVPYVWGRVVLARVEAGWLTSCIAVAATAAAVLGIIESPRASTRSSGSSCRTARGAPGTSCSRGAASSVPKAPSATRSRSRAHWR